MTQRSYTIDEIARMRKVLEELGLLLVPDSQKDCPELFATQVSAGLCTFLMNGTPTEYLEESVARQIADMKERRH